MGRPILGGTETLADIAVNRGSGLTAQQMVAAACPWDRFAACHGSVSSQKSILINILPRDNFCFWSWHSPLDSANAKPKSMIRGR
jgi:hypothetical protein